MFSCPSAATALETRQMVGGQNDHEGKQRNAGWRVSLEVLWLQLTFPSLGLRSSICSPRRGDSQATAGSLHLNSWSRQSCRGFWEQGSGLLEIKDTQLLPFLPHRPSINVILVTQLT